MSEFSLRFWKCYLPEKVEVKLCISIGIFRKVWVRNKIGVKYSKTGVHENMCANIIYSKLRTFLSLLILPLNKLLAMAPQGATPYSTEAFNFLFLYGSQSVCRPSGDIESP